MCFYIHIFLTYVSISSYTYSTYKYIYTGSILCASVHTNIHTYTHKYTHKHTHTILTCLPLPYLCVSFYLHIFLTCLPLMPLIWSSVTLCESSAPTYIHPRCTLSPRFTHLCVCVNHMHPHISIYSAL